MKTHTNVLPSSRSVLAFIPISTRPLFSLLLRLSPLQRSILTHLHWRRHDRFPSVRPALPPPSLARPFPRSVSNGLATLSGLLWMERRRRPLPRPSWRSLARLLANACLNDICRSHAWFEAYYSGPHLCPPARSLSSPKGFVLGPRTRLPSLFPPPCPCVCFFLRFLWRRINRNVAHHTALRSITAPYMSCFRMTRWKRIESESGAASPTRPAQPAETDNGAS